jgi:hypothetical protein
MVQTAHHLLVETDRQLAVVRTMEQTGRAYYGDLLLSLRLLLMLPRQRLANAFFCTWTTDQESRALIGVATYMATVTKLSGRSRLPHYEPRPLNKSSMTLT